MAFCWPKFKSLWKATIIKARETLINLFFLNLFLFGCKPKYNLGYMYTRGTCANKFYCKSMQVKYTSGLFFMIFWSTHKRQTQTLWISATNTTSSRANWKIQMWFFSIDISLSKAIIMKLLGWKHFRHFDNWISLHSTLTSNICLDCTSQRS